MPTKSEMAGALRWSRDHLGAFIATFWMILILFGISGMLAYAFLKLDYFFSRPLAGGVIPADVTQTVAQATRVFTLVAGSLAIYFHINNMPTWRLWSTILGAFGALLLMLHAYGVAAKIMEGQYARAAAVETVAEASVTTVTDQIADIDTALTRAASDRDAALKVSQETIDSVKDQVIGLSVADNATIQKANTDKTAALAAYDAKVKEMEAQKQALRTSEGQAVSTQAKDTSIVETFNPLFTFLARLTTWNFDPAKDPPDGHKYVWGAVFFTLFFGFGELALLFCLTGAFAALKVVSERKRAARIDGAEPVSDGLHDVRMTAEEREAYDKFRKRSEAAALRAKLPIEHREWMRDKKKEIAAGHSGGLSALEIYEASGFVTWHEFENFVNKVFNGKAAAKILGTAPPPETPDPRASTKTDVEEWVSPGDEPPVSVSDSPQDEPEAEPDTDEPAVSETAPEPEAEPEPEPLDETPEPPQANGSYGVAVWKSNPPTVIDDEAEDGDRV